MAARLIVTVIARGDEITQAGTDGFILVDQVFAEANLRAGVSDGFSDFWQRMRILQRALAREFGDRVAMRLLSPWSFKGLWVCTRHRIREFPCLLIGNRPYPLDSPHQDILDAVKQALDQS
jgi:hypothetical protein